jgi:hypothetical protein
VSGSRRGIVADRTSLAAVRPRSSFWTPRVHAVTKVMAIAIRRGGICRVETALAYRVRSVHVVRRGNCPVGTRFPSKSRMYPGRRSPREKVSLTI